MMRRAVVKPSDLDLLAMGYVDLDSLAHDPKIAEALGNMVVAWARVETQLANVFASAMRSHFNLAIAAYYRIPTFEARAKVLIGILESQQNKQARAAEIVAEITGLMRLAKTRNHWIHGVWCNEQADVRDTVVFDFRAPDDSDRRTKPVKAADIKNHVEAVRQRIAALNQVVPLYYYPPAPSP